jgi:hypothetical protein
LQESIRASLAPASTDVSWDAAGRRDRATIVVPGSEIALDQEVIDIGVAQSDDKEA